MPTRYQGTPQEQRALSAYISLLRASNTVQAEAMRRVLEAGISPSQFAVLEALYHVGPMCLSDLARKILRTSGNLTMVVDNLEKRGLVRRAQKSRDRRFVTVEITDAGRKPIRNLFPGHAAAITAIMGRLTPKEQKTLHDLCRKLGMGEARPQED